MSIARISPLNYSTNLFSPSVNLSFIDRSSYDVSCNMFLTALISIIYLLLGEADSSWAFSVIPIRKYNKDEKWSSIVWNFCNDTQQQALRG